MVYVNLIDYSLFLFKRILFMERKSFIYFILEKNVRMSVDIIVGTHPN